MQANRRGARVAITRGFNMQVPIEWLWVWLYIQMDRRIYIYIYTKLMQLSAGQLCCCANCVLHECVPGTLLASRFGSAYTVTLSSLQTDILIAHGRPKRRSSNSPSSSSPSSRSTSTSPSAFGAWTRDQQRRLQPQNDLAAERMQPMWS